MKILFKKKIIEAPSFTEIGVSTLFEGEINSKNPIFLNGEATGVLKSEKKIETGEKSILCGKLFSGEIVVKGKFTGYAEADEKIALAASANYEGEIRTKIIKIEKGAFINGKII